MRETRRENRALWEAWSDDFQALWRADTGAEELPPAPLFGTEGLDDDEAAALLSGMAGADVVELGCGGGQHSVALAREGARSVTGVDFSTEQLAHARRLRDAYGVEAAFVTADVTDVPLAADSFDLAVSSWVLQMVEDLGAALAEARRVLRSDGVLVVDLPHPFYELFDPESHDLRASYHALGERRVSISEEYDAEMVVFDRTIADLHSAFVDAGFTVERVVEPGTDDPAAYRDGALASDQPELKAMVPRSVIFRAAVA